MLKQIVQQLGLDADYPKRSQTIDVYTRILNGELYDGLKYVFSDEYSSTGQYIQLWRRQPSVRNSLCKVVVDQSVSLLFGKDHFPDINGGSDEMSEQLNNIAESINLRQTMIEAALTGSVGSVVLFLRIIEGEIQVEVKSTQYLTPYFDPANPKKLIKLVEQFKVTGEDLQNMGYSVDSKTTKYWFKREWDANQERYYFPFLPNENSVEDKERTVNHDLGFVPAVWIKNLPKPGTKGFAEVDGACTFAPAIDISIEIDYLLSQGGRGLKYASDPMVVFRLEDDMALANSSHSVEGAITQEKKVIRSSSNAFVLGQNDDAKLLEINGRSAQAIIDHVRYLRELAMEGIHGNRSHADKMGAHMSGTAQDKLAQALIWLADILRIYYGDNGMVSLLKMIVEASHKAQIIINNEIIDPIEVDEIKLNWPTWMPPTPDDKKKIAETLRTLTDSNIISKQSATQYIAEDYNIADPDDELLKIAEDEQRLIEEEPQVKETIAA